MKTWLVNTSTVRSHRSAALNSMTRICYYCFTNERKSHGVRLFPPESLPSFSTVSLTPFLLIFLLSRKKSKKILYSLFATAIIKCRHTELISKLYNYALADQQGRETEKSGQQKHVRRLTAAICTNVKKS